MNSTKKINVFINNSLVGSIAMTNDWLCAFQYSKEWLETGFSISPFELPLKNDLFLAKRNPFNGNFGVFDDSLPDGWGLLILDRYLKSININPNDVSILDMLTFVGSTGRGALTFQPDNSSFSTDNADILRIESEIMDVLSSDTYGGDSIENLWKRGGSPGGARPKVFITMDNSEWLVKFPLTRLLTANEDEVWKMFRLMCFNYLISNKDDHAKNFTFLYYDKHWQLSPAYDLLPSNGFNGYHTTSFDGDILPSDKSILRIAIKSGLDERKAKKVLSDMKHTIIY